MSFRRTLEYDTLAQRKEDFYQGNDGKIHVVESQDVTAIVEACKREYNATPDKHGRWKKDIVQVASVPVIFIHKLMQDGILSTGFRVIDEPRWRAWLEEHSDFKRTPGRY